MKTKQNSIDYQMYRAVDYFQGVVNDFVETETPPIMKSRGRDIYVSQNFIDRAYKSNKTAEDLLKHTLRNDISEVIKDWMRTRAGYVANPTAVNPHLGIKNFFAWREVGTTYMYIIDLGDAYIDVVPKHIDTDLIAWAIECERFIECSFYPKIIHYFNHRSTAEYSVKMHPDHDNLIKKLNKNIDHLSCCLPDKNNDYRYPADAKQIYDKHKYNLWKTLTVFPATENTTVLKK